MKIKSFLLSLLLLLFLFSAISLATAETSGDYEYFVNDDGSATIIKYHGESSKLTIPARLDGHEVTGIGDGAFYHCDSLTSVKIPKSIIHIGDNPFAFCGNLKKITVSRDQSALTVVDGVLFSNSDKRLVCFPCALKKSKYTLPRWVEIIGNRAFYYCDQLKKISIPGSVTIIGVEAFGYCSLTSIEIPDGVTAIGDRAFMGCDGLKEITLPASIVHIGINPFKYCKNLATITVSPKQSVLRVIDDVLISNTDKRLVYYPCSSAQTEYSVPSNIEVIGDGAFSNCKELMRVIIPDGVTSIGNSAFYGCSSLADISIPNSVTSIGDNAFRACSSLTNITIPYGVTEIMDHSFSECYSLTDVLIPNSVTVIGSKAFNDCRHLTCVIIPESVNRIGEKAFSGCYNLISVTIPTSVAYIEPNTFIIYSRGAYSPNLDILFTVSKGSYAEWYCEEYGFSYTYPDSSQSSEKPSTFRKRALRGRNRTRTCDPIDVNDVLSAAATVVREEDEFPNRLQSR